MSDSDLAQDYAKAGFRGRLGFGRRPALVLVDLVQAYFEPGSPLHAPAVEPARQSSVRLLAAARQAGVLIAFTRVVYRAGGADGGVFFRKVKALSVFEEGSALGAFAAGIEPAPGELIITKQYASAFFGTSLAASLTAASIDTVIITGVTTSGCVRATAVDAMQNGFIPVVIRDAVGDRDARPHEANLFDLESKYADVVGESEALSYLEALSTR
ncbi:isochorismatase family protein [Vineibacter terrae]|uniref:isochorismatase family protein n=1 Tax=Vineibacter terrae TaxID=2586908 RepID=UPI001E2ACB39|nr:isochorismatase family protein [Vineibacter terrae]